MFLVSESKLGHTFPSDKFKINSYKIFRLHHNRFGGGLILYINEKIPYKPLQENVYLANFEVIATEFNQNNQKWLLLELYKPPNQKTSNVILIGDFNLSSDYVPYESFLQQYNVTSLIKEVTCFLPSNPSCIDLILINQKNMCKLYDSF